MKQPLRRETEGQAYGKVKKNQLSDLIKNINFRGDEIIMSYEKKYWDLGAKIEVEKRYPLKWGAPGIPRKGKKNPTPEQIERQNDWQAVRKLNRLITANFTSDDYHVVLTFKEKVEREEAKKCLEEFLKEMRKSYRKEGQELKYIVVTEYKNTKIHHHIIINDYIAIGSNTIKLIKAIWKKAAEEKMGNPKFVGLYENGDYKELAEYLVKETKKTFREKDACLKKRWSCSRNLVRPEPIKEVVHARTWRKEPTVPKGYYLEKGSLVNGINPITGFPYQHYTLIKLVLPEPKEKKLKKPDKV